MSSTAIQFAMSMAFLGLTLNGCLGVGAKGPECRQGEGLRSFGLAGQSLNSNQLALSFYGDPDFTTAEIATYLELQRIRSVFFVHGDSAREAKGILARLKATGQIVGNGLYSDQNLSNINSITGSAIRTDQVITPYVTGNIFMMRFPDGVSDAEASSRLNREGLAKYAGPLVSEIGGSTTGLPGDLVGTNFSADRCLEASASTCTQDLLAAVRSQKKGIISLPLGKPSMAAVLREFVSTITTEGFEIRNIDDVPDIRFNIQQSGGTPGAPAGAESCNDY